MKYSQQLVWQAVYEFVPNFKQVREANLNIGITTALSSAAIKIFLEIGNDGISSLGMNRSYAAHIIQDALKELCDDGFMTFGEQTEYWR